MPRRRSAKSGSDASGAGGLPLAHESDPGVQRRHALDGLFSATYAELRRMAAAVKRADANATISTSTLVHEAWIKLAVAAGQAPESELHFNAWRRASCAR